MASQSTSGSDLPVRRTAASMTPATQVRAHLECTAGPEKGKTFRLTPGSTVIGRDPSCDVVLAEAAISRQHARIERRGEEWFLVNLSSNGTHLDKQLVEEAVLADQAEIRLGAKTHLVFCTEEVAVSATGRPQFRARPQRPEGGQAKDEEAEPQEQLSLFRRRKKLFIGLGAYVGATILLLVIGLVLTGGGGPTRKVARLGLEDSIRMADGQMLQITREAPEGFWAEDQRGQLQLVRLDDLRSGRARRIPGIRNALIKQNFDVQLNRIRGDRLKKDALDLYDQRNANPANLFLAVRRFQQSLACYGGQTFFAEPVVDNIYREAVRQLVNKVHDEYTNAVLYETSGDYAKAYQLYKHILDMIPDTNNLIVRNVLARIRALPKVTTKSAWD